MSGPIIDFTGWKVDDAGGTASRPLNNEEARAMAAYLAATPAPPPPPTRSYADGVSALQEAANDALSFMVGEITGEAQRASITRELRAALTLPPARSYADEDVARIINPDAGWDNPGQSWMSTARADALAKAAAIRLLSQGEKA